MDASDVPSWNKIGPSSPPHENVSPGPRSGPPETRVEPMLFVPGVYPMSLPESHLSPSVPLTTSQPLATFPAASGRSKVTSSEAAPGSKDALTTEGASDGSAERTKVAAQTAIGGD